MNQKAPNMSADLLQEVERRLIALEVEMTPAYLRGIQQMTSTELISLISVLWRASKENATTVLAKAIVLGDISHLANDDTTCRGAHDAESHSPESRS